MIKSVTVQNPFVGDDPLVLNLPSSHEEHGIYIKSITGIGPDKATINTTSLAMEDGGIFNSAKSDIRNIVITLGFYESSILHNSIEDSRHLTYKYFPKKKDITLIFETDNRSLYINGWVESNEPDIFSKDENTQISIICPDPNFYSIYPSSSKIGGIDGLFEFIYENNSVGNELSIVGGMSKEDQQIVSDHNSISGKEGVIYYEKTSQEDLYNEWVYAGFYYGWYLISENKRLYNAETIISEINEGGIHDIYYNGDEDVGVVITIHFKGEASNIVISNVDTDEILHINTSIIYEMIPQINDIESGDDIVITTIPGSKSIEFVRGKDRWSILNAMDKNDFDNAWFKLHKGLNRFMFTAESGFENIKMIIDNNIAYNGI